MSKRVAVRMCVADVLENALYLHGWKRMSAGWYHGWGGTICLLSTTTVVYLPQQQQQTTTTQKKEKQTKKQEHTVKK